MSLLTHLLMPGQSCILPCSICAIPQEDLWSCTTFSLCCLTAVLPCVLQKDLNLNLLDHVSGKVPFSPAQIVTLGDNIYRDIKNQFSKSSLKNYTIPKRKKGKQLLIMQHVVVLSLFIKYAGNELGTSKEEPHRQTEFCYLQGLDRCNGGHKRAVASPQLTASTTISCYLKEKP